MSSANMYTSILLCVSRGQENNLLRVKLRVAEDIFSFRLDTQTKTECTIIKYSAYNMISYLNSLNECYFRFPNEKKQCTAYLESNHYWHRYEEIDWYNAVSNNIFNSTMCEDVIWYYLKLLTTDKANKQDSFKITHNMSFTHWICCPVSKNTMNQRWTQVLKRNTNNNNKKNTQQWQHH